MSSYAPKPLALRNDSWKAKYCGHSSSYSPERNTPLESFNREPERVEAKITFKLSAWEGPRRVELCREYGFMFAVPTFMFPESSAMDA
jgi:hypothetical protein